MDLRVFGLVVLVYAGVLASPAADAAGKIETVTEQDPRHRLFIAYLDRFLVFLLIFLFETAENLLDLGIVHFLKVLLEERFPE